MKILILSLLLVFNLFGADKNNNKSTKENKTETVKEKLEFIKVSDIPDTAVNLSLELNEIEKLIEDKKDLTEMKESLSPYAESISMLLKTQVYKDVEIANLRELQKMKSELAVYVKQLKQWKSLIKSNIEIYDENKKLLKKHSSLWSESNANAKIEKAPKSILKNIKVVIKSINKQSSALKLSYDKILNSSQIITKKILLIDEMNNKINNLEIEIKNRVFYQNQEPYFTLVSENSFSFSLYFKSIKTTIVEKYSEVIVYFKTNSDKLLKFSFTSLLSFSFAIYFAYLYSRKKLFLKDESYSKKEYFFIKRVFSTLVIIFILNITAIFSDRAHSLNELNLILILIPTIRIIQTVIKKEYYKYMYLFASLYVLLVFNNNSSSFDLESRTFLLLINIAIIGLFLSMIFKKALHAGISAKTSKVLTFLFSIVVLSLVTAIFANLYGSVLLSSRILDGIFLITYVTIIFYAFFIVLSGYVVITLRKRMSKSLNILDKYALSIESTTKALLKIWMFLWWSLVLVKIFGVYEYLLKLKDDVLASSWEIGQTVISVQSIFDFLVIILGTWILAKLLKIFLEVELFSRFKFPRGMPTAILTTINYFIVITGTILAFSSLGVNTQQFALVIGALGVGIGFGLRNIIANFVSGIIMVFERPVQIGDTIEINNTMGCVQSIGARSSTLKTFDGSEVIIPNADFIAKEIINWTLSDEERRKTIEFKLALDNDIDIVLDIMKSVSRKHKDVLVNPEPVATFQGFGEYFLTFKLYFWLSDNIIKAQSELSIEIYKALKEHNVNMPIPRTHFQKEL